MWCGSGGSEERCYLWVKGLPWGALVSSKYCQFSGGGSGFWLVGGEEMTNRPSCSLEANKRAGFQSVHIMDSRRGQCTMGRHTITRCLVPVTSTDQQARTPLCTRPTQGPLATSATVQCRPWRRNFPSNRVPCRARQILGHTLAPGQLR